MPYRVIDTWERYSVVFHTPYVHLLGGVPLIIRIFKILFDNHLNLLPKSWDYTKKARLSVERRAMISRALLGGRQAARYYFTQSIEIDPNKCYSITEMNDLGESQIKNSDHIL
jgi:hypothetical protein